MGSENPMNKWFTTYCPPPPEKTLKPDWNDHPSWITGMQALEEFHRWVAAYVLPIAFQWIEENKTAVYAKISKDLEDDVGVVIAAAYELVKTREAYEKGQSQLKKLEEGGERERPDPSRLNPVWARITREVRKATKEIFEAERKHLDGTID